MSPPVSVGMCSDLPKAGCHTAPAARTRYETFTSSDATWDLQKPTGTELLATPGRFAMQPARRLSHTSPAVFLPLPPLPSITPQPARRLP